MTKPIAAPNNSMVLRWCWRLRASALPVFQADNQKLSYAPARRRQTRQSPPAAFASSFRDALDECIARTFASRLLRNVIAERPIGDINSRSICELRIALIVRAVSSRESRPSRTLREKALSRAWLSFRDLLHTEPSVCGRKPIDGISNLHRQRSRQRFTLRQNLENRADLALQIVSNLIGVKLSDDFVQRPRQHLVDSRVQKCFRFLLKRRAAQVLLDAFRQASCLPVHQLRDECARAR
jgi:hypothetical protein